MNIWQIGFVVRSGVSALVVAFLLGYAAHHQWGLSRSTIRTDALLAALLIGTLVAIEFFGRNLRKPKK
jgi:predicted membrane protein